jgi:hypothetical protein
MADPLAEFPEAIPSEAGLNEALMSFEVNFDSTPRAMTLERSVWEKLVADFPERRRRPVDGSEDVVAQTAFGEIRLTPYDRPVR